MPKLNDTQLILLSAASQREDLSLYPLPDTLQANAHTTKAITALVEKAFVEERETASAAVVHRADGEIRYGLFATHVGLSAIGIGDEAGEGAPAPAPLTVDKHARVTKASLVVDMLKRPQGASLEELIAATDWLPHTTRAALTGLRKKGHDVARSKVDGKTRYAIVAEADRGEG
jgi:hypothetical protein